MTAHSMRPAAILAWTLGALLAIANPQAINAAGTAVGWTLTTPAGSILLGAGFLGSLYWAVRGRRGRL